MSFTSTWNKRYFSVWLRNHGKSQRHSWKGARSSVRYFKLNTPRPTQIQKMFRAEIGNPQPCVPDGGTYQQAQETPHPWDRASATHFPIPGSLPRGHQHPHQAHFYGDGGLRQFVKVSWKSMPVPTLQSFYTASLLPTDLEDLFYLKTHNTKMEKW